VKHLVQQLSDQAKKSVPHGLTPDKWIEVYNELFAELIVRECAEWIKNTDSDPDIGEEDAKALLQHFGVE
jgi:hypothetical protein